MNITELQTLLQKLTKSKITQAEIAEVLGKERSNINRKAKRGTELKYSEIQKLERYYNVSIASNPPPVHIFPPAAYGFVQIEYQPNLFISDSFTAEAKTVKSDTFIIDGRFLRSDKGAILDPDKCKIVSICGNALSPEYKHGDKVIIDKSDMNFTDGQIYAFSYKGQCYIKEINRAGEKIKCISINNTYEPFFIDPPEQLEIFGRVIPRIRL